jgi:hypothetical protein
MVPPCSDIIVEHWHVPEASVFPVRAGKGPHSRGLPGAVEPVAELDLPLQALAHQEIRTFSEQSV